MITAVQRCAFDIAATSSALAETGTPHLRTHEEAEWMGRLDAETGNFRAALDWALREGQPVLAVRLAGRLGRYWSSGVLRRRRSLAEGGERSCG